MGKVPFDEDLKIWLGHGTADRTTYFAASEKFMKKLRVKDKEFKAYDGWYHKLHAEPGEDKLTFANDVADWIIARSGTKTSQPLNQAEVKSRL